MSNGQAPKVIALIGAVVAMVIASLTVFLAASSESEPGVDAMRGEPPVAHPVQRSPEQRPVVSEPVAAEEPNQAPAETETKTKTNRMARDLRREQIWAALRREHNLEPAAPGQAAPSESAAALLPSLDSEYIRDEIVEQLVPVLSECYDSALEDDPELAGKVVLNFTIVGAEEVGGVVEDASIAEGSTLASPFVRECMRESVFAVSFEPPPEGGRLEVSYPFEFQPE